jgi:hypothetical protein
MEALTALLETLSRSNPILMIFEDAHWLDPTSLEVLGRTVDWLKTFGVLLIVMYRPEFEPPWIGRPYVTAVTLNRLGEPEIAVLIDRVTGHKSLPSSGHSPSPANNKPSPGNSAPPSASPVSGTTRTRCSKRANCWLRYTGGSLRGSIRAI